MASKGEKRRKHREKMAQKRSIFDVPEVPRRDSDGGYSASRRDRQADPRRHVLSVRCKLMGISDTEKNRAKMGMTLMGDPAGQAISIGATDEDEASRLWAVFAQMDGVFERYHRRILQCSRHAKCGKVEFLPERFETSADDSTDTRTRDEIDRDTVFAWMRWHGAIACLPSADQAAIWDGVYLRAALHRGGALTGAGSAFVLALRGLRKAVDGEA